MRRRATTCRKFRRAVISKVIAHPRRARLGHGLLPTAWSRTRPNGGNGPCCGATERSSDRDPHADCGAVGWDVGQAEWLRGRLDFCGEDDWQVEGNVAIPMAVLARPPASRPSRSTSSHRDQRCPRRSDGRVVTARLGTAEVAGSSLPTYCTVRFGEGSHLWEVTRTALAPATVLASPRRRMSTQRCRPVRNQLGCRPIRIRGAVSAS